jgi:hypothetical protein
MPPEAVNERMMVLEDAMQASVERKGFCRNVYNRTGNNLKEFAYYIRDRDSFSDALNAALADHPRYPIEIKFYEDPEWTDFLDLLKDFERAGEQTDGEATSKTAPSAASEASHP